MDTLATKAPYQKGISGSTLKIIAIISMFIDHFAAIVLADNISQKLAANNNDTSILVNDPVYITMMVMRCIGRLAFPIFCFLLIEGFLHTRNKMKYAARLLIFAIVSEVPFDLAFNNSILEFSYQNVFFTLFLGLVLLIFYDTIQTRYQQKTYSYVFLQSIVLVCGILLAVVVHADYFYIGVMTIFLMYCYRQKKTKETLIGCLVLTLGNLLEIFAFAIYPLIKRYNGERGLNMKYFFYVFYPAHILLLVLISHLLGYR